MSRAIIEDLISFLNDEKTELRISACQTVASLTGTQDGLRLIMHEGLLSSVLKLINDSNTTIAATAYKILINISSEEAGASFLFGLKEVDVVKLLIDCIQNPDYPHSSFTCGVLANLTRVSALCPQILSRLNNELDVQMEKLVRIFCQTDYNKKGSRLDLLASVISNFTQCLEGRREILDQHKCIIVRLLPFVNYQNSLVIRKAVISAVRNCCFEKDSHSWLLSDDVDIAGYLAYPLAGPDTFSVEENDSFPLDLQFLPDNKCRENNEELRAMLLEALMQLCSTKEGREKLRALNIYLILREYHKWEKDARCQLLVENVVDVLIKTEEEMGVEDLTTIEVPSDITEKFINEDTERLQEEEAK